MPNFNISRGHPRSPKESSMIPDSNRDRAIGQGVGVLLAPLTGKIPSFLVASAISIGIGVLLAPLTGGIPLISVASAVALLGMVRFSLVRLFKGFLRTQNQTIGLVHRL